MQGVIARRAGITDTLYSGVKLNKRVKPYDRFTLNVGQWFIFFILSAVDC